MLVVSHSPCPHRQEEVSQVSLGEQLQHYHHLEEEEEEEEEERGGKEGGREGGRECSKLLEIENLCSFTTCE